MKRNVDFFAVSRYARKKKKQASGSRWLIYAAAGVAVLALAGAFAGFRFKIAAVNRLLQEDQAYVNSPANLMEYQRLGALSGQVQTLLAYNSSCQGYIDMLKQAPRLDDGIFRTILSLKPEGATITGYQFKDGSLDLICATTRSEDPAAFAQALDDSGAFVGVKYKGFDSTATGGIPGYQFTISCTLWAAEGGE